MRFKVGDKVRIREDLIVGKDYGNETFIDKMNQYKGQVGIIKNITINEKGIKYQLLINNNQESFDWFWSDEMLEPYSELKKKEVEIFTNKKGTKVFLKGDNYRSGSSKWNGKDKYDEKIGILIATARALKFDEEIVQDFIKAIFKEEDKKENIKKEEIKKEPKLSLVSSNGTECDFEFREEFNKLVQDMSEQIPNKLNSSNIPKENKIKVKIIEPKNNRGGIPRIILEDADLKNSSPKSECNCTCKTKNKESNKKEQENQTKANNSSSSKEELSNLLDKEIDKLLFLLSTLNSDKNRFNFWDLF